MNLLTKTEQFDDAVWSKGGVSITADAVNAPDGTLTADFLNENTSDVRHITKQGTFIAGNIAHTLSVYAKAQNRSVLTLCAGLGLSAASANFYLTGQGSVTQTYTNGAGYSIVGTPSITPLGDGWYRCVLTVLVASNSEFIVGVSNSTTGIGSYGLVAYTGNVGSGIYIWGADLRPADQATGLLPAYQRVNTSTDYDTVGFPRGTDFSISGTNSALLAASGGGGTTAFLFCASITVKKVGATQTLFSDTGTNTGYRVRINSSNQLELSAGSGSSFTTIATANTVTLGKSHVVTAWHDGTNLQVQLDNGTVAQTAFATASAGTAGFTIGTDNGTAGNWFQGRIFEYVYRKNAVPTAADISNTKTYCASKAAIA